MHQPFPTDLSQPGAIEQLLAAHRNVFGDLRMEADDDGDAGDDASSDDGEADGGSTSTEKGFPANTPLAEMTVEQREAYWKDKSRKHEARANERADYDELKAKADRLDELERQSESDNDKAIREATEKATATARAEARDETARAVARMAMRARGATDEDIEAFVTETNLSAFVSDDGQVDDARLLARVERYAGTASGNTEQWPDTGRRGGGDSRPERRSGKELRDQYLRS